MLFVNLGEHALKFDKVDGLAAALNSVTVGGTVGDGTRTLFFSGGTSLPTINGTIETNATNATAPASYTGEVANSRLLFEDRGAARRAALPDPVNGAMISAKSLSGCCRPPGLAWPSPKVV